MRNTSVELLNEEPVQAPPPINVGCSPEYFRWNQYDLDGTAAHFPDSVGDVMRMGILGAGFEVKNAETDDFKSVSIANFTGGPYWHFSLLGPYYLKSTPGTYIARIKHLGGPFVKRGPWNPSYAETESEIYFSLDSKPVYLKITVDSNGKVTGEEINGYEQKLLGDL